MPRVRPDDDEAGARHQEPVRARRDPVRRRRSTCSRSSKPTIAQYWGDYTQADGRVPRRRRHRRARPGRSSPTCSRARSQPSPVDVVKPTEGATGWSDTWMINSKTQAPQLRLQVHRPHGLGPRSTSRSPSGSARRRATRRPASYAETIPRITATSSTPTTRPSGRTSGTGRRREATASTAGHDTTCKSFDDWVEGLDRDQGLSRRSVDHAHARPRASGSGARPIRSQPDPHDDAAPRPHHRSAPSPASRRRVAGVAPSAAAGSGSALLLRRPLGWLGDRLPRARWSSCSSTRSGRGTSSPGTSIRELTLENFEELLSDPVYRDDRRSGRSAWRPLVTVTCAVLAFPIAYYMARVASPRTRGILVVAVLMPLWASYLVKVYSWRMILAGERRPQLGADAARARRVPGYGELGLVARVHLPLAAVHDPADLRRPGADPELAARGVVRPRRQGVDDVPAGRPAARRSRRSSPARSSRSR